MIHFFNPGHETAILNESKYYMAPANVVTMQKELCFLPAWYAPENDYVFVEDDFPTDYYDHLIRHLDRLPLPVTKHDLMENPDKFAGQEVYFWGISPQAGYFFEKINDEYNLNLKIPVWKDVYKELSSRKTASDCLKFIIDRTKSISTDIVPVFFSDLSEIEKYINQNNSLQYLAKAPFSSSGRGLLWLPKGELTRTERQILHGHLKKQGYVSLEKVLDKKLDFALEFYIEKNTVRFEGISLFKTNNKGAYLGNYLYSQERMKKEIEKFVEFSFVEKAKKVISGFLSAHISPHYQGYAGVDMLIYEENSAYWLHPCLEINLRNNMGILAIQLQHNVIADSSAGFFTIDFNNCDSRTYQKHKIMQEKYPAIFEKGKIKTGYLSLCPVKENNKYNAYLMVE